MASSSVQRNQIPTISVLSALRYAQRAITLEPDMTEPYFLLGTIRRMNGRSTEAVQCLESFIGRADMYLAHYVQVAKAAIAMLPS